ncbi:MAG: hypothetical protein IPO81_10845 [Kouleothrix sp.]|nr:hypothetical protein [Kouleothrix sp.]
MDDGPRMTMDQRPTTKEDDGPRMTMDQRPTTNDQGGRWTKSLAPSP